MIPPPPTSTLFPYTTLFRSSFSWGTAGYPSIDAKPMKENGGRDGFLAGFGFRSTRPYSFDHRRSEEHTSELQSHHDLVCRLLLEKKNKTNQKIEQYQLTQRM